MSNIKEALTRTEIETETWDEYVYSLHELLFEFLNVLDYEELSEDQKEIVDLLVEYFDDDYYYQLEETLDESRYERIVRGGKVKRRLRPKKGYKVVNNKYIKMSEKERKARRRSARKAAKKRRTQRTQIKRKSNISKRRRNKMGL